MVIARCDCLSDGNTITFFRIHRTVPGRLAGPFFLKGVAMAVPATAGLLRIVVLTKGVLALERSII